VVVVAGRRWNDEGESLNPRRKPGKPSRLARGGDRTDLALRPDEVATILAAASANPRTAVVLVGGSAITLEAWRESVPAILMAWYPGMEGGNALAGILFGDVSPSGKLPFTLPADPAQLPDFDPWAARAEYGYYHGYTLFDREQLTPAYPFGHGLSYTTFELGDPTLSDATITSDGDLRFTVPVTNTGDHPGAQVVQAYVTFPDTGVDRPDKLLRAFDKVHLEPGEAAEATLHIPARDLARYDPDSASWIVDPGEYTLLVGTSSTDPSMIPLTFQVS